MILRDYQIDIIKRGKQILLNNHILYLNLQTRLGKTIISLKICQQINPNILILFLTTKLTKKSILSDYKESNIKNQIIIQSVSSLHKLPTFKKQIFIIVDQSHVFGTYPKMNKKCKLLKQLVKNNNIIYLSATPSPQSFSQIYHQLCVSNYSPFKEYKTFYRWADKYVIKTQSLYNNIVVQNYSNALYQMIYPKIQKLILSYSKKDAGFDFIQVEDIILEVQMKQNFVKLCKKLHNYFGKKIITKNNHVINVQSQLNYMNTLNQFCGGTLKQDKTFIQIDNSKVLFINQYFKNTKKIVIFYKYKGQQQLLKKYLDRKIVKSPQLFNKQESQNIAFISQFKSGRQGINLSSSNNIIFYNMDYSYLSYLQTKNRIQSFNKDQKPFAYFLFSNIGLQKKIYKKVINKHNFTKKYLKI